MSDEIAPLLSVRNLKKHFPVTAGFLRRQVGSIRAVDGVDFDLYPGGVLGLVGESGSGKSTLARSAIRLIEPTEGELLYRDCNVRNFNRQELSHWRREVQMIFQDPNASLNPRRTVGDTLSEPLLYHGIVSSRAEAADYIAHILDKVGLNGSAMERYPHTFSGGQQQRICIGRALALKPHLIVCDEAVSALDVSVQAQILNLLSDLKEEFKLSYLFIAHDLAIVRNFCDHVVVLYLGQVMESAPVEKLFSMPLHPYTRALLSAAPRDHPTQTKRRFALAGEVPSALNAIVGCPFRSRCPYAEEECKGVIPWQEVERDHRYRCIFPVKKFEYLPREKTPRDEAKELAPSSSFFDFCSP